MVTPLTFIGGDDALIQALKSGHPGAAAVFYDQHAPYVHRVLRSTVGVEAEVPDLLQEVFIRAIDRIAELEDMGRVRGWLTTIAIFAARAHLRRGARRKWLSVFSPERTSQRHQDPPSSDARRALRDIYGILDGFPENERTAFTLRIIEGMTLTDAADAGRMSLATFKRRLARAEKKFLEAVRDKPTLEQWLEEGTRWGLRRRS